MSARAVSGWVLAAVTLGLFLVWSNTFLAFEVLLAPKHGDAPLSWADLAVARMVPVAAIGAVWCFGFRRRESLALLRRHPRRLVAAGLLCVPGYNGFLYFGMQHHVAGPIASVLTTLSPLYLAVLGAAFLGERLTGRKVLGLALGLGGVACIASARGGGGQAYALHVVLTAMAPLCWSVYTALTKPVLREVPPVLWTYLVLVVGAVPLLPLLPFVGGPALLRLDAGELALLAYLVVGGTIAGNAVWSWLLHHLPASTVGLTIFLNPPLTTASKAVLAALLPASFTFAIAGREWLGGLLAMAGVGVAVLRRPRAVPPSASPSPQRPSSAAAASASGPGNERPGLSSTQRR